MGIETAIIVGLALSAASAAATIDASAKEAKAVKQSTDIQNRNLAKSTKSKAAQLTTSFLSSGLTLDGTSMDVIQGAFQTGLQDINQNSINGNNKSKSIINAGRTQALETLAGSFVALGGSAMGGGSSPSTPMPSQDNGTYGLTTNAGI